MADEEEGSGETEGAAPPKSSRLMRFLLLGGVALLLLVGVVAGLYFSGIAQAILGTKKNSSTVAAGPPKPTEIVFYDLPDMLVNLNVAGRHENYLKLDISLQIESKQDIPKIDAMMPRVMDTCQTYLRELRLEDLRGSAGLYRMREELLMRIGIVIAPVRVDDVLFKQLLVQ